MNASRARLMAALLTALLPAAGHLALAQGPAAKPSGAAKPAGKTVKKPGA